MYHRIAIVVLTLGVLLPTSFCMAAFDEEKAKKLFEKKCTQCHGIQDYDMSNRSLKEWQLTVERMASYGVEDPYTEEEADDIITYLRLDKHNAKPPGGMYGYEEPVAVPAATQPTTVPATASVVPAKPKRQVSWRKSRALGVAKFMGYAATAIMALMVASGLARKRIPGEFSSIHMVLAIALFGALSIHVSVYLCEYGAPSVLWLWFGILASVLIGLVEFGGLMRRKLGASFIRLHSICGAVGLLLVLLHWFWIYV
jgi:hypothetical protein